MKLDKVCLNAEFKKPESKIMEKSPSQMGIVVEEVFDFIEGTANTVT